jgi:single-stranded-DNA-specific exonuclease
MSIKFVEKQHIDDDLAADFAKRLSVSVETAKLLLMRGFDTPEKVDEFFYPKLENMSNPYNIANMDKCVERLRQAFDKNETVVIYGDYDCAIFYFYFKKFIPNVFYYVPNRNEDGYGITINALDELIETKKPHLFISVDCGITAVNEVAHLKSRGVDVIITDHHEPQKEIPDCIVVNPKIERKGFCDFCGAGIALKVVEAIGGRDACLEYIGFAATATIADIVPMVGENRIIAYYGLQRMNGPYCTKTANIFKDVLKLNKITSQDIMYKIAPRLNAPGRVGNVNTIMRLFFEDDLKTSYDIYYEIDRDNELRKKKCEEIVAQIKRKIADCDLSKQKIILLYDEKWEPGILGIAAAKLTDMFNRPAILFSPKNGELKGSARSIKTINLFDCLSKFSDMFVSFGGHSSAAGLTILEEKFEEFSEKINKYISETYSDDSFVPVYEYDLEISVEYATCFQA